MKRMNNDMAVSPIVATLVLIVVAVIGAVAVGTIMGTFSNGVAKQVNANGAASASATGGDLLIAGSTTVYPASVILAKDFMAANPATQITVQQGGSGAGVSMVGQGIIDIGASSSALSSTQIQEYPNLQTYQIGSRAVVWIVNKNNAVFGVNATGNGLVNNALWTNSTAVTPTEMKAFISQSTAGNLTYPSGDAHVNGLVQRADASGTESTASIWTGYTSSSNDNAFDNAPVASLTTSKAETGNAGVLAEIQGNTAGNEIGFVDLGYVLQTSGAVQSGATNVVIIPVTDSTGTLDQSAPTNGLTFRTDCQNAAKDYNAGNVQSTSSSYPQGSAGLISNLYYITNGTPSPLAQNFITFAQSPTGGADMQAAGDFALYEVKV